ncbi:MAG: orotidine-5'-phosphate decarboxylase [Clostridiales bacterium]|nr:orotidine-5'-phosphate decarboxylase [Clostridiales bacterium]
MGDSYEEMRERLIVALDVPTRKEAFKLVKILDGEVGAYKIGMQLYNSEGPDIVRDIQLFGGKVFVDLKFHDIPNTVAQTSRVMARRQAFMYTMHAGGGSKMLRTAVEAAAEEAAILEMEKPLAIAVTVLTSINQNAFEQEMGVKIPIVEHVVELAKMAQQAGMDGVVCSPQEIGPVRAACGPDMLIVTPGIRPAWASSNDQERVLTPQAAIKAGASYLVVGRPIITAADPKEAARKIVAEMMET